MDSSIVQFAIVGVIVGLAAAYLCMRVVKTFRGANKACGGCPSDAGSSQDGAPVVKPFVSLESLERRPK